MPTYKITYFDVRARAEVARLLFYAAGKEFEDKRVSSDEWKTLKPNTPLGQLPILTIDKTDIPQSGAMNRYLAREFGFYGKNNLENVKCDVILETINDIWTEVFKGVFEKDETKKKEAMKNLVENSMPKFVKFVSEKLKENGGKFLVGDKLSVADIALFDTMDRLSDMAPLKEAASSNCSAELKAHMEKVKNEPNIKKWLDKRPKTEF